MLRHRRFTSLSELNEVIVGLVTRLNDKPFKKLEGSRSSLFKELDQPAPRPLPAQHYEFATWRSRPHPEQGFRSALGVMRLAKKYSPELLEAACERALTLKSFSYKSIESMLSHGLGQRPLRATSPRTHVAHRNIRGPNYYQ